MTDRSESERLARANRAEVELQLTSSLFDDMESALIAKWRATSPDQTATREKMHQAVQVIDTVRKALMRAVQDGEVVRAGREMAALLQPADQDRR